jgi:hypothetical protein
MASEAEDRSGDKSIDENQPLVFNGIDATTGQYLLDPLSSTQLARLGDGGGEGKTRETVSGLIKP